MRSIALLFVIAACTDEVPATPTYQADIAPILAARCVRCHAFPQISAAHEDFRLDMFEDRDVANALVPTQKGVQTLARPAGMEINSRLKKRITGFADDGTTVATMPPRFPLTDVQIDTIVRWCEQGAERGPPRPGNHPPELVFETEVVDGVMRFDYELSDLDDDLVTGVVIAKQGVSQTPLLELSSGRGVKIPLDGDNPVIRGQPAILEARIDDGAGVMIVPLGTVEVIP